jgi:hypothetical protein
MKKPILSEQQKRMQKLAGINEDNTFSDNHTVSNEQYELMDKTANKYAVNDFLDAAETIMGDFEEAGFPARDAFYWFYTKLTANI